MNSTSKQLIEIHGIMGRLLPEKGFALHLKISGEYFSHMIDFWQ